uniref:Uncharacterized protein n=1 Tax=Variovorax sp. HH01 TaxID=1084736 RepID=I3PCK1_9BURK|nr:hypothetical protein var025 [Variovorax sp. HH01]
MAPPAPELATATSLPAGTRFLQTIAATDGDRYIAPGQANVWDLRRDFSLGDGGDDQFDGALQLLVEVQGASDVFPSNQTYAELTALGPEMGPADGVKSVSFTDDTAFLNGAGRYAYLHPGVAVRLQQTLNLTGAVGPAISVTWNGTPAPGNTGSPLSDPDQYGQVVVRDTAGALLATLFRSDGSGVTGTWGSASLAAFAGQTVVLSFEQRVWANSPYEDSQTLAGTAIDKVSVKDSADAEFVVNGDFEAQGTGWTVMSSKAAQNVSTGTRTLKGLEVQRTFYTQPNLLWARMTDVFHNPTAAPIVAKATYRTNLGSDGLGIIYPTPGATGKALTTWDYKSNNAGLGDRDVGFAFGSADVVYYLSDPALGARQGSDDIRFSFDISVPAGGTLTLMNFVVMSGTDTGLTATDINARATEVDTQLADIASNFRTNFIYQRGLTQVQLDTLKNF